MWSFGFGLLVSAVALWSAVTIVGKAGYREWWGLLILVPFVNVLAVLKFALADWPALRRD